MKENLKAILKMTGLYHPLQSSYRNFLLFLTRFKFRVTYGKYRGSGFVCNYCGAVYRQFAPEYPGVDIEQAINSNKVIAGFGENVYCPNCLSKNRERLVKVVMDHYIDCANKDILHFSPERHLYKCLKKRARVTTIDIEPGFYKTIDASILQGDATGLQFADNSFDILIANHILEHIPEDVKAMREMFRVLRNGGVAVLQAPWSQTLSATIEDRSIADPEKQARLYGQKDHVRIYTLQDYVSRLTSAGFTVKVIQANELTVFSCYAIQEGEPVVLGYKS